MNVSETHSLTQRPQLGRAFPRNLGWASGAGRRPGPLASRGAESDSGSSGTSLHCHTTSSLFGLFPAGPPANAQTGSRLGTHSTRVGHATEEASGAHPAGGRSTCPSGPVQSTAPTCSGLWPAPLAHYPPPNSLAVRSARAGRLPQRRPWGARPRARPTGRCSHVQLRLCKGDRCMPSGWL